VTGGDEARGRDAAVLLALSYVGFISLGLPDGVLGAAWPAMRAELGLPLDGAGQALLLATAGTILSSLLSGRLLGRLATGTVLAGSTALAAVALLLYARAPSWPFVLGAAVLAGFGGGAVDAALNGFVARHYGVWHMNWLHGFWAVGATIGPLTVAVALGGGRSWRAAYLALFLIEATLALAFVFTRPLWRNEPDPPGATASGPRAPEARRLTPAMRASVLAFFVYTGVEAGIGLWRSSLLVITRGVSPPLASLVLSGYWGMLMAGRFLLGALAEWIGPARLLSRCCWTAVGALLVASVPGLPLVVMVAALGSPGTPDLS
jgi:fucose permease